MPRRMPRRFSCPLQAAVFVSVFLVPFCAASDHWNYEESRSETRDFVTGGMLYVRLSVGDLKVRRCDCKQIRLHYTVKSRRESHVKDAHVDIEVRGNYATIEFHAPSTNNTEIDAELEVPKETNLDVHQNVGDLTVDRIEGDKDLELGVGDIRVVSDGAAYHLVQASTSIGDVSSDVKGNERAEVSGWLGKTLKYHGEGKYELHAHVSVGDITIEER